MKTTRIIISTALVALATTSFGQLGSVMEKLFPNRNEPAQYTTAQYLPQSDLYENHGISLTGRALHRNNNAYEAPVVCRTIYAANAEVIYEDVIRLEKWMAAPFEAEGSEEEVAVELWMAAPFKAGLSAEEVAVESWMTTPFELVPFEEEIRLESWMTTPFETGAVEKELYLEEWMTTAFQVEGMMETDGRMIASIGE